MWMLALFDVTSFVCRVMASFGGIIESLALDMDGLDPARAGNVRCEFAVTMCISFQ